MTLSGTCGKFPIPACFDTAGLMHILKAGRLEFASNVSLSSGQFISGRGILYRFFIIAY